MTSPAIVTSTGAIHTPTITYTSKSATASPKKQGSRSIYYTKEDLSELRLEDLKNICRERGIKGYSVAKKKDDLIAFMLNIPLTTPMVIKVSKGTVEETVTILPPGQPISIPGQPISIPGQPISIISIKPVSTPTILPTTSDIEYPPGYEAPITIVPGAGELPQPIATLSNAPKVTIQNLLTKYPTETKEHHAIRSVVSLDAIKDPNVNPQLATNLGNIVASQVLLGASYDKSGAK